MVKRMRDEKFCWIFDSNEDFKLFQKARKGWIFEYAARELFGRPISREESYKKNITLQQLAEFYEKSAPEMGPALRNFLVQAASRDWMSALAGCIAGMLPSGSFALPRLVHSLSLNKEVSKCAAAGDLARAKSILKERGSLSEADANAVERADDFPGLRAALHDLRVLAGVQVMASLAWDCSRSGMGDIATYRQLFLSKDRNQKRSLKEPQRIFFEWLEKYVKEIDRGFGYSRGLENSVHHKFFSGNEEGKKYLGGDKKFSLQEYDAKLSTLWPLSYREQVGDVTHSILSKVIFSSVGQQLCDEIRSQAEGDDFERMVSDCIACFDRDVQLLMEEGEQYLPRLKELMGEVKGLESSPAP